MSKGNKTGRGGFAEHPENRHRGGNKPLVRIPDALRRIGAKEAPEGILPDIRAKYGLAEGVSMLDLLMVSLYDRAINGDIRAVQFIADRTEGKLSEVHEVRAEANTEDKVRFYLPVNNRDMQYQQVEA